MARKQNTAAAAEGAPVDKAAKFKELATQRVTKAIKATRLIGNLSNRSSYEYTDEQAEKIVAALREEVDRLEKKFKQPGGGSEPTFTL